MVKRLLLAIALVAAAGGMVGVLGASSASAFQGGNNCTPIVDKDDVRQKSFQKPTCATMADPVPVDKCGTKNDTFTIVASEGVGYLVSTKLTPLVPILPVTATTYQASTYAPSAGPFKGVVTVRAYAKPGYSLQGDSYWKYTFTDKECVPNLNSTGVCDEAKQAFVVTVNNSGDGDGEYTLNGTVHAVAAMGSDVQEVYTGSQGADVKLEIDGVAVINQRFVCIQGQGAVTVVDAPKATVVSLPHTSGDTTGLMTIVASIVSALGIVGSLVWRLRSAATL